jgi:hypothetical protein
VRLLGRDWGSTGVIFWGGGGLFYRSPPSLPPSFPPFPPSSLPPSLPSSPTSVKLRLKLPRYL